MEFHLKLLNQIKLLCFERSPPIGAPAVGDMLCHLHFAFGAAPWQTWGSGCRGYVVSFAFGAALWQTWGSSCRGYVVPFAFEAALWQA